MMDDVLGPLTAEEASFQEQIRVFLEANLTPDLRRAGALTMWAISQFDMSKAWQKILHAHGYGAVHWPSVYGGKGWTARQKLIWEYENTRAHAPKVMNMGRDLCAPCIMKFGTDAQKADFLPRILSGDDWWAQGFSEPNAGSDLAALQLKGEIGETDIVLNGSKIWTTFAQYANRIFCLARTGASPKKQMGISFLLIDMDTPGISLRPIHILSGDHEFNQVFFDNVRVPRSRVLGAENDGWSVVRYLLQYEHGGVTSRAMEMAERLDWLEQLASVEEDGEGNSLLNDPDFARRMGELFIDAEAISFAEREATALQRSGGPPSQLGELMAIRSREVGQAITELAMRAIGRYGAPFQKDARSIGSGVDAVGPDHILKPTPFYFAQRAATIAGGTPDIHRNNVAKRLLGL
ncbi:MAG: acyl-CoA dehydrogenase family protein [Caulobacterales bacterium]